MTTVIQKIETNCNIQDIVDAIPLGTDVFGDINILSKYYKQQDGTIWSIGDKPSPLKCFPKTLTLYCKKDETYFKIRWFYSKKKNTIHLASGLKQEDAADYLRALAHYFHIKDNTSKIQELDYTLVNGLAQAKYGVNLYKLSKMLDESNITYVYTPDRHAALKIYMDEGTVCIHSTGKILYMGSKTTNQLMKLHNRIQNMGKEWEGVPVLVGLK